MGFLAPWFLAGLRGGRPAGLAAPAAAAQDARRCPFSSLMFFERRTQSSIKHRRLQYLLLFALRAALIAAAGAGVRASVHAHRSRRRSRAAAS